MIRNFRISRAMGAIVCALLLGVVGAVAQDTPAPLVSHTFEESDGGWQAVGGDGVVSLTHDAALVKNGKGALQYTYSLRKGEFSAMLLPTPDMLLSKAKSLRFW